MSLLSNNPRRGDVIVDSEGRLTESFARFLNDLTESNNNDNPLNNFRASGAPAVTNNREEGYTIGSVWIDAPTVYQLTSFASDAKDANATWTPLN